MTLEERIAIGEDPTLELKAVSISGKRVDRPDAQDVADEFAADEDLYGRKETEKPRIGPNEGGRWEVAHA